MLLRPPSIVQQNDNLSHLHTQSDARQSSKSRNKPKKKETSLSFKNNKALNSSRQNQQKQRQNDNGSVNSHGSARSKKSKKKQSSIGINKPKGQYISVNSPIKGYEDEIEVLDYVQSKQVPERKYKTYNVQYSQVKNDFTPVTINKFQTNVFQNRSPNIQPNQVKNSFKDVINNLEVPLSRDSSSKQYLDDQVPVVKLVEVKEKTQKNQGINKPKDVLSPKMVERRQTKKLGQLFEQNRKNIQNQSQLGVSAVPSQINNSSLGTQSRRSKSKLGQLFKQKSRQKQINNSSRMSFTQNASSNYQQSISDMNLQLDSHMQAPKVKNTPGLHNLGSKSKEKQHIAKNNNIPEKVLEQSGVFFDGGDDINKSQLNLSMSKNSPYVSKMQNQYNQYNNNKDSVCFNLQPQRQRQKRKKGLGIASKLTKSQDELIKISGNLVSKQINGQITRQAYAHQKLKMNLVQNQKYLNESGAFNLYNNQKDSTKQQEANRMKQKLFQAQRQAIAQKNRQLQQQQRQLQIRKQQDQKIRKQEQKRKQQKLRLQEQRKIDQQKRKQQQRIKQQKRKYQQEKRKQQQKKVRLEMEQKQKLYREKQAQRQRQRQLQKRKQQQRRKQKQRQDQKQRLKQKQRKIIQQQLQAKKQKQRLKQAYLKEKQEIKKIHQQSQKERSIIYQLDNDSQYKSELNNRVKNQKPGHISKLPSTLSRQSSEKGSQKSQQSKKSNRKKESVIAKAKNRHFVGQISPRAQQSFYQQKTQQISNAFQREQKQKTKNQPVRKLMSFSQQQDYNYEPKHQYKTDTYFYDKSIKAPSSKPPLSRKSTNSKSKPKEGLITKKTKQSQVKIKGSEGGANCQKKLSLVQLAMRKNYQPGSDSQYRSQDSFRSRQNSRASYDSRNSKNSSASRKKESVIRIKQNNNTYNRPPLSRKNSSQNQESVAGRTLRHQRQMQQRSNLNYTNKSEKQDTVRVIKGCSFIDQKGRLVQNGNMVIKGNQVSGRSQYSNFDQKKMMQRLMNSRQKRRSKSRQRSLNRSRASSRSIQKNDSKYSKTQTQKQFAESQAYSQSDGKYDSSGLNFYGTKNQQSFYQNYGGSRTNFGNTYNGKAGTPQNLQQFIKPIQLDTNRGKQAQVNKKKSMQRTQKSSKGKY